jgi:hypothetical protein
MYSFGPVWPKGKRFLQINLGAWGRRNKATFIKILGDLFFHESVSPIEMYIISDKLKTALCAEIFLSLRRWHLLFANQIAKKLYHTKQASKVVKKNN